MTIGGPEARRRRRPAEPVPVLEVTDLVKNFPIRAGLFQHKVGEVQAVSGVSFSVGRGETLGHGGGVGVREVDDRPAACCG